MPDAPAEGATPDRPAGNYYSRDVRVTVAPGVHADRARACCRSRQRGASTGSAAAMTRLGAFKTTSLPVSAAPHRCVPIRLARGACGRLHASRVRWHGFCRSLFAVHRNEQHDRRDRAPWTQEEVSKENER